MIEEMEYQLKKLLKNNQPQDYIEIIEKENEEYIEIINNLQSKIDKAIEYLYEHSQYNDGDGVHYIKEDEYCVDYLLDILKEENNG